MMSWLKGYVLYAIVFIIAMLLLGDIYLIYQNNQVISFNKRQQEEAEKVKVNTSEVMRSLHLLDLAVRSYAFLKNDHFKAAINIALKDKHRVLSELETALRSQKYAMAKFYFLYDSIESYVEVTQVMISLIEKNNQTDFIKLLEKDPGYSVWLQFQNFSGDINSFEDEVSKEAQLHYDQALTNIYMLQVILFFIAVPTLLYTAYYTNRALSFSERLRKSEEEKSAYFSAQNQVLEKTVYERTKEILAQNEEITAQNEEIGMRNSKLEEAKGIIENQNKFIQQKNAELAFEVKRQTQDLKQANLELIEHNSRLEQFTFIISHNLRAPMARIVGLSSILEFTKDDSEITDIVKLMTKSTSDLDQVIKDLNLILGIQKMQTQAFSTISLDAVIQKITETLTGEIKETKASVSVDFTEVGFIKSLPSYIESIFYNLIDNAIKYRHPDRTPSIAIQSRLYGEYAQIDIADNGLGIDIETYKDNLFSLYKRFHFHVDGKGLGLYLVKTQLTALGGRIEIKSKEGVGTTFSIFIKKDDSPPTFSDPRLF